MDRLKATLYFVTEYREIFRVNIRYNNTYFLEFLLVMLFLILSLVITSNLFVSSYKYNLTRISITIIIDKRKEDKFAHSLNTYFPQLLSK